MKKVLYDCLGVCFVQLNSVLMSIVQEWVLSSLEAVHWVDEEPYEMVDFSPAVRNLRYHFNII